MATLYLAWVFGSALLSGPVFAARPLPHTNPTAIFRVPLLFEGTSVSTEYSRSSKLFDLLSREIIRHVASQADLSEQSLYVDANDCFIGKRLCPLPSNQKRVVAHKKVDQGPSDLRLSLHVTFTAADFGPGALTQSEFDRLCMNFYETLMGSEFYASFENIGEITLDDGFKVKLPKPSPLYPAVAELNPTWARKTSSDSSASLHVAMDDLSQRMGDAEHGPPTCAKKITLRGLRSAKSAPAPCEHPQAQLDFSPASDKRARRRAR